MRIEHSLHAERREQAICLNTTAIRFENVSLRIDRTHDMGLRDRDSQALPGEKLVQREATLCSVAPAAPFSASGQIVSTGHFASRITS